MPGHRAAPPSRWDVPSSLPSLDAGRLLLIGLSFVAAGGSAFAAFITTEIRPQVEKVQQQVNQVPAQLQDATDDLQAGLDDAGDRINERIEDRRAELDRLAAALSVLQGEPEPTPSPRHAKPRQGTVAPRPVPAPPARTPTAAPAPADPVQAMCTALQIQCSTRKETP